MKWISRGSVGKGFARSSKLEKLHGASCDTTLPIEAQEAEIAMRVARENERSEVVKQVEDRHILAEMALRLRVSLFAEVSTTRRCQSFQSSWRSRNTCRHTRVFLEPTKRQQSLLNVRMRTGSMSATFKFSAREGTDSHFSP